MIQYSWAGGAVKLDYYALQQLAVFYQTGTLKETAEKLHISQPTLTRSMQKIEAEFGVPLFNRTKNSIALNDTGLLAAQEAELLLRQTEQMIRRVRDYDKASRTITIGACTPVPVPEVVRRVSQHYPETVISSETKNPVQLLDGVKDGTYQMILLPFCPEDSDLIAYQFGEEHLSFLLPKRHRFARRKSLSVAEMNGENMLLFHDIGFWHDLVVEKMPDSRFLIQTERYSFRELIENSTMPVFTTDALPDFGSIAGRIAVPISDPEFNVTYYVICRKKDKQKYAPLFE